MIRRDFFKQGGILAAGALAMGSLKGCGNSGAKRSDQDTGTRVHALDGIGRENLKITDVTVTPFSYEDPKGNLWRSDAYVVWKTDGCLTRVYTDQGIIGIGEGSPYAGPEKIRQYTEEVIREALIGKNPFDVHLIGCGGTDWVSRCAWAGVDNALWDIIGKAKGTPVYKLLAGDSEPDPHILIYASGGDEHEWYKNGEEALISEALKYREQGFTGMKFRAGTDWKFSNMTLEKYGPILQNLRKAVGPGFRLMHETLRVTGLTMEQVLEGFCPLAEEVGLYWFEEPMKGIENHVRINEALESVMVTGGELLFNRFQVKEWLDRGAYDIVQTDTNITGITENWHIARMAQLEGKYHCPHNWHGGLTTMANAHLVAAIPNRHMLELNQTFNPLKEEVFKEPLVVKDGYMDLPDKPGFGVEVIDDLEKKFPYAPGLYYKPNPVIHGS